MTSYDRLPQHMRPGARRYIEQGIPPGGFLIAVLKNDFRTAAMKADRINKNSFRAWADWLVYEAPREAWGSEENVRNWIEKGGLNGTGEEE